MDQEMSVPVRGQIVRLRAASAAAEAYRSVRTCLCLGPSREARTVLITSPIQGDGKSTTASNLAIALAQAGERVLLIDADLHRPVQQAVFGADADAGGGLAALLTDKALPSDVIKQTAQPGLHLLPAGPLPQNPSELLGCQDFKKALELLSRSFDRIVIDSPPLLRFNDARILAASVDVTLLVLRMNQSLRSIGMTAVERLAQVGANVLGVVVNDVPAEMLGIASEGEDQQDGYRERQLHRRDLLALAGEPNDGRSALR
jgi:capsular exopolysaccharide synthesis family protein